MSLLWVSLLLWCNILSVRQYSPKTSAMLTSGVSVSFGYCVTVILLTTVVGILPLSCLPKDDKTKPVYKYSVFIISLFLLKLMIFLDLCVIRWFSAVS